VYTLYSVETKNPAAVTQAVLSLQAELFPGTSQELLSKLFREVEAMFTGHYMDYQAIDLGYHDFEHTLQATLCFARMFAGRHRAGDAPRFSVRHFELGIAAVLLHDSGYLRQRADHAGTSAKYTHIHVLRSCAMAAGYLPTCGCSLGEIGIVTGAIRCTGPGGNPAKLSFATTEDRLMGCMLVTADYLGQMAARDYPDELAMLYRELQESDLFFHVKPERYVFKSAEDLIAKTPNFWEQMVRPKLDDEFAGVYRFLASPYPDGPNPYVEAIDRNIDLIRRRLAAAS